MFARYLLCFALIVHSVLNSEQAALGSPESVKNVHSGDEALEVELMNSFVGRNLDTVDYDEVEEADDAASDEMASASLVYSYPDSSRSQMGSAMSSGMQTGGGSIDKFGAGLSSWGTSVSNMGQGWSNIGQSVQMVDEKIG